jgi:hypothetical protein
LFEGKSAETEKRQKATGKEDSLKKKKRIAAFKHVFPSSPFFFSHKFLPNMILFKWQPHE